MSKLVRLKPFDTKKGHLIRRYTVFSTTFEEHKGWYRVSDDVAAYLATLHQVPNDEDTPLAFDVCSQAQAEEIDQAEKKRAEERARAAEPNAMAARDVSAIGGDPTTADPRDPARRSRNAPTTGRRP